MNLKQLHAQADKAKQDYQAHSAQCQACADANLNPATAEEARLTDRPVVRRCSDGVRLLVTYAAHVRKYSDAVRAA